MMKGTTLRSVEWSNFPGASSCRPSCSTEARGLTTCVSGVDILARGSGYSRPIIVFNDDPKNLTAIEDSGTALACLAAGTCHQLGYDTKRGDPFFQLDMRFAKNIRMGEHRNLQLIFQAFNLTNKTNYGSNFHNTNTYRRSS